MVLGPRPAAYEFMRTENTKSGVFCTGPDMEKALDHLKTLYAYQQAKIKKHVKEFISHHTELKDKENEVEEIINRMVDKLESRHYRVIWSAYYMELQKLAFKIYSEKALIIIGGYPPFLKDLMDYVATKGIDFKQFKACAVVGGQATSSIALKLIAGGFTRVFQLAPPI